MSLSTSLANALSGMTAASRRTQVVSSNLANALTDGYGRREVELAARSNGIYGAGVTVTGVRRNVDVHVLADRRLSDAELGNSTGRSDALGRMEAAIGIPDVTGSLSERVARFETALIDAGARPDSTAALENVRATAQGLVTHINGIGADIQAEREQADADIAVDVRLLNRTLKELESLNYQVARASVAGHDLSVAKDRQQQLVDQISGIVPIREVQRDRDTIALFTTGGLTLLDSKASEFSFTEAGLVTPYQTLANGSLSGLQINGRPVETGGSDSPIRGGSLFADFAVRDELAPDAQTKLDAFARDLIDRFADPTVDPTLGAGDPGLFTDDGSALVPADELGLAQRISLNALADPAQGGEIWRLRDGLGAAVPGEVGNGRLLLNQSDAMAAPRVPTSGGFTGGAQTSSGLAAELLSRIGIARQEADNDSAYASARHTALREIELSTGVDTDNELQELLLIEQAYAANARVIQTVDDMMQTVLGI